MYTDPAVVEAITNHVVDYLQANELFSADDFESIFSGMISALS